jgi:hypothetical protein
MFRMPKFETINGKIDFIVESNIVGFKNPFIKDFDLNSPHIKTATLYKDLIYQAENLRVEGSMVRFCLHDEEGWIGSYLFTAEDFFTSTDFI